MQYVVTGHAEQTADQQRLDLLAAERHALERQHGQRRRHRVDDADHGLGRDGGARERRSVAQACEHRGAGRGEGERVPGRAGPLRCMAREERNGGTERGDLREGQVDEDHAAREHVQPEPRVNAGEHQRGRQRPTEHLERHRGTEAGAPAPTAPRTPASRSTFRSKRAM